MTTKPPAADESSTHASTRGRVLIIDDDADLLDSLEEIVRELCHRDCLALPSFASLVSRADELAGCGVAILDINLGPGQPSGLDVYRWLCDAKFTGRTVFLTGHAHNHPLVRQAQGLGDVRIIEKPTSIDVLREVIEG